MLNEKELRAHLEYVEWSKQNPFPTQYHSESDGDYCLRVGKWERSKWLTNGQ